MEAGLINGSRKDAGRDSRQWRFRLSNRKVGAACVRANVSVANGGARQREWTRMFNDRYKQMADTRRERDESAVTASAIFPRV